MTQWSAETYQPPLTSDINPKSRNRNSDSHTKLEIAQSIRSWNFGIGKGLTFANKRSMFNIDDDDEDEVFG
jgi:hypothetical protein